jgi:geranyl-CoA carboxylase alpha subunit
VFGDRFGNLVHLGERDCSVQRRHQKVIEEAPSPALDAELRARMGAAAVEAARAVGYAGAGTVEFLLDREGGFYFLEMNTRLQVEHPVTELVTGLDLVALQLDVAAGKPLPFAQADVRLCGWAMEARLYADDPAQGFLPQTGRLSVWRPAAGEGVRVDHGLSAGAEITPFYDPMIAKVIAVGDDREAARRRLIEALRDTAALGVGTNKAFLIRTLEAEAFAAGEVDTGFLGREFPDGFPAAAPDASLLAVAAALLSEGSGAGWRSNAWLKHPVVLEAGGERRRLSVRRNGTAWQVGDLHLEILDRGADRVTWRVDGHERSAFVAIEDGVLYLDLGDAIHAVRDVTFAPPERTQAGGDGRLRAPMSGLVSAVHVAPGDPVRRGQLLMVLEAMKMEHQILSPRDGVALTVAAAAGAQVAARDLLAEIGE